MCPFGPGILTGVVKGDERTDTIYKKTEVRWAVGTLGGVAPTVKETPNLSHSNYYIQHRRQESVGPEHLVEDSCSC